MLGGFADLLNNIAMPKPEQTDTPDESRSLRPAVKRRTRPASHWHEHIERRLAELTTRRRDLRLQIAVQRDERRTGNPFGEETLTLRTAHQQAKSRILGEDWQRAVQSMKHAGRRVRALRRQLERFRMDKQYVREDSGTLTYWVFKAPFLAWKERSARAHLRQANHQRRTALKVIRLIRPAASSPEVRTRIHDLTERLLVADERLKHSIQSLCKTEQSVSSRISDALRLVPQLRGLGERPVTMDQRVDPFTREVSIPKPTHPLGAAGPVQARKNKVSLG